MTRASQRQLSWMGAAFLLGTVGYLAFGPRPPAPLTSSRGGGNAEWNLSAAAAVRSPSLQQDWRDADPWNARPAGLELEGPPPPPPAVPVAIVREGGRWRAVFIQQGVEQRAGAGEPLNGGGQVRSVDEMTVQWDDAQGETHVRELFADPVPAVEPPGASPMAPGQ